ncbi:MAG: dTMP kinase [Planctomycetota bacterium]|nr:dTMP kinase [Planctomycetota bacterium]
MSTSSRPLFVVLDGIDGCGKSTQAARLAARLGHETGRRVHHLREPGSTRLGEALRGVLLGREYAPTASVETLLFAAARAQMLAELVQPALGRGEHVVCERFHPSTFAYQAVAGGLPEADVLALLQRWAGDPRPTHVVLLELSAEAAAARRGGATDRIEDRGLAFQREVARGYARYADLVPGVARIDAARDTDVVAEDVWWEVARALR